MQEEVEVELLFEFELKDFGVAWSLFSAWIIKCKLRSMFGTANVSTLLLPLLM